MKRNYKVASMFAGIGGICLGFKNEGCELVWANEIDKYACETYRHNFNGAPHLVEGDIHDITRPKNGETIHECLKRVDASIPDFDILTAGFPCQAFSIAGERKGFEDERGNLFFEILTILDAKRPKAFLLENVKNLKSHDNGNTFKVIKEKLEELGYYIKAEVLNSMTHGNIPQNRERIFIVGFDKKELIDNFEFPEPIKLTTTIADIIDLDDKKDDKYYYNTTKYYEDLKSEMTKQDTLYQIRRGQYIRENKNNVCPTLTANMGTGGHNVPLVLDNYDIRKLTPEECLLFQGFNVPNRDHKHSFPEYTVSDKGAKRPYSNGQKYKQAGNCVTVTVIERIAHNMINSLNSYNSNIDVSELVAISQE
ncbi:DNA (cytosine-5-)-methyltransferase [Paraclostridium sordellii]|uniref:DNA (cytosine-5-)-methyltransferase n=1 Tax=Paraclostridium sordellii TaxID=1505 RepID=UPI0030CAC913